MNSNSQRQPFLAFVSERSNLLVQLASLVLLLGLAFLPAAAQQTTGSLVGTVNDAQGALVTTATVKAINVDTGFTRSAPANGYGEYRIDYLPVGTYTVEVTAPGFERFVQKNIALDVGQTLAVNITLAVGAASQTVTVTEAPPVVNTSDATLGRTIEPAEVLGLPLVNRNTYTEISLTPGIMANSSSTTANPSGTPNFQVGLPSEDVQVNGSLDSGNGTVAFYLDGGNNITGMRNYGNPAPNPDAVEEVRIDTNAFAAEYGQFSGAIVSVITKSGTNKFHGSAFEFNRNTDLNAWNWGATPGSIKAPYHRNQYGGTFGGPIKRDKSFFFFSYAGLRQIQGGTVSGATVPTLAERQGDFTQSSLTSGLIYKPGTGKTVLENGANSGPGCQLGEIGPATAGYCIAQADLDKTALALAPVAPSASLVSIPLPNGAVVAKTGGALWSGIYNTPTDSDEYLAKYDENLGTKDHVGVTYFFVKTISTPSGGGNVLWTGVQSHAAQTNVNISDVHTFTPSVANQTWLTFTRAMGGRTMVPVTGPQSQTLASFGSNFQEQGPPSLPQLTGAGFNTGNPNAGPVTGSDNYELRDMVSMTKGKHNLDLGGEFSLDKTMFLANLNNYGEITFSTSAPTSTGVALADFMTGQISAFEQDSPYVTHLSTWHVAAFAQDDYRITTRLTVNLGLRWDIDTPPTESKNRTESFVPGQQSTIAPGAPVGVLFPGDKGIGRGIVSTPLGHFSPRFGFAFDPFGDGKTSIRGAVGIFYGTKSGNEWNQPGNNSPFAIRNAFGSETSLTNIYNVGFPSTAAGGGIFPYTYNPASPKFYPSGSIEAIGPNFKDSSVYQYNFSVQRQLPYKITVSAAYVGTLGRHLNTFIDANYAPYATVNSSGGALVGALSTSAASYEQRRQFDGGINLTPGTLNGITYLISDQTSNYNGLQLTASKAMARSFTVSGFYVWSRALEGGEYVENGGMTGVQDYGYFGRPFTAQNNSMGAVGGGLGQEYQLMANNRNGNAAISGMWTPNYVYGNKIAKEVFNGWTISPIAYFQSGQPNTVSSGSNLNFDSLGQSRPNYTGVGPNLGVHRCRVCAGYHGGQSSSSVLGEWFNSTYVAADKTNMAAAQAAGMSYILNGPGVTGGIGPGGADGNVRRGTIVGPGLKQMDAGLLRDVNIEGKMVFQFRFEVTNVMNWVNLNNPTTSNITSGSQGTITSTANSSNGDTQRIMQLGGRLTF
ncbi:MAG: carboxypeptidase-like regulatory domain-containing protein [Terracidiphilus sp.]